MKSSTLIILCVVLLFVQDASCRKHKSKVPNWDIPRIDLGTYRVVNP
jgi:hypothetical protein